jgi:hypothetical protein
VKGKIHTVAAKESLALAPKMSHPILRRVKMYNLTFLK